MELSESTGLMNMIIIRGGIEMFEFNGWNVDLDGDGIADTAAADLDGCGIADTVTADIDGDGFADTFGIDSNGDGVIDTWHTELDTDNDGWIDMLIDGQDYDQDGVVESQTIYHDYDENGLYEEVIKWNDADGDGVIDDFSYYQDTDADGSEDVVINEQYLDQDGDGEIDTYVISADENGGRTFEAVEVYNIDEEGGKITVAPLAVENINSASGLYAEDLGRFEPETADMDAVLGNPGASMELWEYQGDTGRCALYSQKFVIEELTHQEIDIETLADIAQANGWFDESSGTPLLNMDKILDYFGIENEMSFHNDFSDLQRELEAGKKIIVSIDADEIWYGETNDLFTPGDGPNHAVEVIGIDYTDPAQPMVILNDSGNPNGCGATVPADVFIDAWEDGNCQMISCI